MKTERVLCLRCKVVGPPGTCPGCGHDNDRALSQCTCRKCTGKVWVKVEPTWPAPAVAAVAQLAPDDYAQRLQGNGGLLVTKGDLDREAELRKWIAWRFNCEVVPFGLWNPIDCFGRRGERVIAFFEHKCRSFPHDRFRTTYIDVRKWLDLRQMAFGGRRPPLFIVRWTDVTGICNLDRLRYPLKMHNGGGRRAAYDASDEIQFEIPVSAFRLESSEIPGTGPQGNGSNT